MDRRSAHRCPVCQGPATADESMPDGVRCRRSICTHNHSQVVCPRCGHRDLESVGYAEGHYSYTCRECTNSWKVKG